jgi:hypothetical protein
MISLKDFDMINYSFIQPKINTNTDGRSLNASRDNVMQILALYGSSVITYGQLEKSKPSQFTLGFGVDADCAVPSDTLPVSGPYPIAEMTAQGSMLVNVPFNVSGEVLFDGQLFDLNQLRVAGRLRHNDQLCCDTLQLPRHARCRLYIGEFSFIMSSMPDPGEAPKLSLRERLDSSMLSSMGGVTLLMMFMLGLMSLIPESPQNIALAHLTAIERYVTIDLEVDEEVTDVDQSEAPSSLPTPITPVSPAQPTQPYQYPDAPGPTLGQPEPTSELKREMAQDAVNSILNSSVGLIGDSDAVSAEALGAFTGVVHQHLASAHPNSLGKIGVPQGTDGGRVHGTKKSRLIRSLTTFRHVSPRENVARRRDGPKLSHSHHVSREGRSLALKFDASSSLTKQRTNIAMSDSYKSIVTFEVRSSC